MGVLHQELSIDAVPGVVEICEVDRPFSHCSVCVVNGVFPPFRRDRLGDSARREGGEVSHLPGPEQVCQAKQQQKERRRQSDLQRSVGKAAHQKRNTV